MTALERLGMKGHKRYGLVVTAMDMIRENDIYLTKNVALYEALGQRCGISAQSAAAQIHTVSKCAWRVNRPVLEEIAHHRLPKPPTTSTFLAILYIDEKCHPEEYPPKGGKL